MFTHHLRNQTESGLRSMHAREMVKMNLMLQMCTCFYGFNVKQNPRKEDLGLTELLKQTKREKKKRSSERKCDCGDMGVQRG